MFFLSEMNSFGVIGLLYTAGSITLNKLFSQFLQMIMLPYRSEMNIQTKVLLTHARLIKVHKRLMAKLVCIFML